VSADLVCGLQWGDEGKGKAVDYISKNYDVVARFNGGDNAGHTVVHQGSTYKFHVIPSGVLRGCLGVIGSGVVLNPSSLEEELRQLSGWTRSWKVLRATKLGLLVAVLVRHTPLRLLDSECEWETFFKTV